MNFKTAGRPKIPSLSGKSARMKQQLGTLGTLGILFLLAFCSPANSSDDFCQNKSCPKYKTEKVEKDFVLRSYSPSNWITTRMNGNEASDIVAANNELKDAGYVFHSDNWPVLITQNATDAGTRYFLSWFVPDGTTKPQSSSSTVRFETKPAALVYVRVFDGTPTRETGEKMAESLRKSLENAGRSFNPRIYVGVGYEGYFSLFHHNEIWIYAN